MSVRVVRPDRRRTKRTGFPEVVMAEGKTPEQISEVLKALLRSEGIAIASRVDPELLDDVEIPEDADVTYDENGRVLVLKAPEYEPPYRGGRVGTVAAGTSDLPYLSECITVLKALGIEVHTEVDVGVAGPHRLLTAVRRLRKFRPHAVVAAAGMDGTMPVALNAMLDVPVIGLPTPIGYGVGGSGEAALLGMLQSCSPGLVVVNVANGIGAAAAAVKIVRVCLKGEKPSRKPKS
ncbi:nickel pincer cofactor biosynthesis protein LarB [Methanopyrus sp.]